MKAIDLNGLWEMRRAGAEEWLTATIPGSVAATLLAHGRIPNPYTGDNENQVLPVFNEDYEFRREFEISPGVLKNDRVFLHCDGLDTIADITVNGKAIGSAENMFRAYQFDLKPFINTGKNSIAVFFHSPVKYLEAHPSKTGRVFAGIRKAACMFGWDWGINLPDSGIWRDIYIETQNGAKLDYTRIQQRHEKERVTLKIAPRYEILDEAPLEVSVELTAPGGEILYATIQNASLNGEITVETTVASPALWWPVGYGSQPRYTVRVRLLRNGQTLDEEERKIGLRTISLNRSREGDGARYEFVVNQRPIFFRGENLIIDDAILSRSDKNRWDRLIRDSLASNLNGIRVWGGAYYPPDYFYELCDRYGLLVFQDFMFACTFYPADEPFLENVHAEVRGVLKRIAHHPCIALYCGNNEVESIYTVQGSSEPETVKLRQLFGGGDGLGPELKKLVWAMYAKLFLDLIPKECADYAPETAYTHSSPSIDIPGNAESFFDYFSRGDAHYYLQYDGNAPYQKIRRLRCRFVSEMGFQSYPSLKTIAAFTDPQDRSPYSPIMYAHQKCRNGNEAIEEYMARDYGVPKMFEDYVYLSQLQAAEIMKYSVEHFRLDSDYCRGVILWQHNDCWPVVSWSGIDYYGRWKALQYAVRKFFSPLILLARDDSALPDKRVRLWVRNDGPGEAWGKVIWCLRDHHAAVLLEGEVPFLAPADSAICAVDLDFSNSSPSITGENQKRFYLEYILLPEPIARPEYPSSCTGTLLFVPPKDFDFILPHLDFSFKETQNTYEITIHSDCYVKALALDLKSADAVFSDNWFDLSAGTSRTVSILKSDVPGISGAEALRAELTAQTLNQVVQRTRS